MSSETSTEKVRLKPDAAADIATTHMQAADKSSVAFGCQPNQAALQPWQFFVLAALGCATAVTFIARGQGVLAVVLLGVLMAASALVGLAALRAAASARQPGRGPHRDDRPAHARGARAREDADAARDQGARVRSRDGEAVGRATGRRCPAACARARRA